MLGNKLSRSGRCSIEVTRKSSSFSVLILPYESGQGCPRLMLTRYCLWNPLFTIYQFEQVPCLRLRGGRAGLVVGGHLRIRTVRILSQVDGSTQTWRRYGRRQGVRMLTSLRFPQHRHHGGVALPLAAPRDNVGHGEGSFDGSDWKTIKAIFTCMTLGKEIPPPEPRDFSQFAMLNEAWDDLERPQEMDSDMHTTQPEDWNIFCFLLMDIFSLNNWFYFYFLIVISFYSTEMLIFGCLCSPF